MELRPHWRIRIWYKCKVKKEWERERDRSGGGRGGDINVTLELNSSTMVIQYLTSLSQMSAISNSPTATNYFLNFEWILFTSLLLHLSSRCLSFIQPRCSIWLHGNPFVSLPHPVQESHTATKKRSGLYRSYSSLSRAALLLMLLIRLLYMLTYTPFTTIMYLSLGSRKHSLS